MSAGEATRARFIERMQTTAVGAQVARRRRAWTIVRHKAFDTSVSLTLRHGRREFVVHVPVCITGPVWWQVGLHPVAAAPTQRGLF